ncbi:SPOR domain-containing protein [Magnetospirillum sp. UT-4]|uniref:SPOR domain-containing protein n=1 Tax=Magnetospirillum sp. UT-4 TaxID=2681467 RepID=UPI0013826FBD|nr:SPOR domain-containing protein [Magnetospirillum sp. UT-4]CAA7618285.1 conserved exported hypothetical protein [Magnetospirillum sp. UT-4]
MRRPISVLALVALLPLAAACTDVIARSEADLLEAQLQLDRKMVRPGLENLPTPQPDAMEPPPPVPMPLSDAASPFPSASIDLAAAERLLAGDPMALRFLALKELAQRGLVPPSEAAVRRDANLGALLPLTAPQPPAAGLDRPIPPVAEVADRFDRLWRGKDKDRGGGAAERGFMLDQLLPAAPARREALAPPDVASARKVAQRTGRLKDAGLITASERDGELLALEGLIASEALPEVLAPPAPQVVAKPKPKKKTAAGAGRGQRMEGGVSGRLEVIPSPPGVEAPKLPAGFGGPVGVHLLSMGSATHGDKAWEALKTEFPDLATLSFKVAKADLGELGATYRLIAGPLDQAAADKLCAALKGKGQTCTPTPFPQ